MEKEDLKSIEESLQDKEMVELIDGSFTELAVRARAKFPEFQETFDKLSDEQVAELGIMLHNVPESDHAKMTQHIIANFYERWQVMRELVAVQAVADKDDNHVLYEDTDGSLCAIDAPVNSRTLRASWSYEAAHDLEKMHGLDAVAELKIILGQEAFLECSREVIADLRNIATPLPNPEMLTNENPIDYLHRAVHAVAETGMYDWMVSEPEVIDWIRVHPLFESEREDYFGGRLAITRLGKFEGLRVYVDRLYPAKGVLFGSSSHPGYYCGIYGLSMGPVRLSASEFAPRRNLMVHYFKKAMPHAEQSYGKMTLQF